jgi:hypothetical protein
MVQKGKARWSLSLVPVWMLGQTLQVWVSPVVAGLSIREDLPMPIQYAHVHSIARVSGEVELAVRTQPLPWMKGRSPNFDRYGTNSVVYPYSRSTSRPLTKASSPLCVVSRITQTWNPRIPFFPTTVSYPDLPIAWAQIQPKQKVVFLARPEMASSLSQAVCLVH